MFYRQTDRQTDRQTLTWTTLACTRCCHHLAAASVLSATVPLAVFPLPPHPVCLAPAVWHDHNRRAPPVTPSDNNINNINNTSSIRTCLTAALTVVSRLQLRQYDSVYYTLKQPLLEILYGAKNSLHAFDNNSAKSEEIWMKSGIV